MLKLILYGTGWTLVVSQWHDLGTYYCNPVTPAPLSAVIITILATVILTIATIQELTKKGKK